MRLIVSLLVLMAVTVIACKEKEVLTYPALTDYYSLKVGRTYTYRMDSIVPSNFGASLVTKYYLAKDSVESQYTDPQGRTSFRIFRYITDTFQSQPWRYIATYVASFDNSKRWVEYLDNNLRYIVLREPITEGFSWKGNSFIDTKSGSSVLKYMDEWDYTYQDISSPFTVRKGKFDTTISVVQVNEVPPASSFNPTQYFQSDYSIEVYAKGVGLIYKDFLHKTWNFNSGTWSWEDGSYGIRLNLVSYK